MRTLRRFLPRSAASTSDGLTTLESWGSWIWPRSIRRGVETGDVSEIDHNCNHISVLGPGVVASVDSGGTIALIDRQLSVDVWIGAGDRWWYPAIEGSVRQRRVEGLPIIETRMRVGDADVVWTAWADEPGDGIGRVTIGCETETADPVVLAIVVRPFTPTGLGRITRARVVDNLIVVDGRPVAVLPRPPGDVIVGSRELGDCSARFGDDLVGDLEVAAEDGSATLAAMIPLAPGAAVEVQLVDGREEATVAPPPLDITVAGWKSHLAPAAHLELPGWPKHVLPSLLSGMISSPASSASDRALIAGALVSFGLNREAERVVLDVLDDVASGTVPRGEWSMVASAVAQVVMLSAKSVSVLKNNADTIGFLCGEALQTCGSDQQQSFEIMMRRLGNVRAAEDIAAVALSPSPAGLWSSVLAGGELEEDEWRIAETGSPDRSAVEGIVTQMIHTSRVARADEGIVALRSAAGSTWRWGNGDDPAERARIAVAMRALVVRETDDGLDLVPGIARGWFGQNVSVERLPTRHGLLSFALRWHGARPALLWELESEFDSTPVLRVRSIDGAWSTTDVSGEVLLEAPPEDN